MDARDGAHSAKATWNRVSRSDSSARAQMFGVCMSPDVVPITDVHAVSGRMSSATIMITSRLALDNDGVGAPAACSSTSNMAGTGCLVWDHRGGRNTLTSESAFFRPDRMVPPVSPWRCEPSPSSQSPCSSTTGTCMHRQMGTLRLCRVPTLH